MTQLVRTVSKDFPGINFKAGNKFTWSPSTQTVIYETDDLDSSRGDLALLHEVSHALLKHNKYANDLELLNFEVSAWKSARELAKKYNVNVSEDYIDDCLESYRDWLYKRSTCVECGTNSLQNTEGVYICHICGSKWTVPDSQLCRVQRRKI